MPARAFSLLEYATILNNENHDKFYVTIAFLHNVPP